MNYYIHTKTGVVQVDRDTAETIRSELEIKVHSECLEETSYTKLEQPAETGGNSEQ